MQMRLISERFGPRWRDDKQTETSNRHDDNQDISESTGGKGRRRSKYRVGIQTMARTNAGIY